MPDTKFSDLTAVTTPTAADFFPCIQGGVEKRETRAQLHALEAGEHLVLPQVDEAATPTLAFGDGDSGFYQRVDNVINISLAGALRGEFGLNLFRYGPDTVGYPVMWREVATSTNPVWAFNGDPDTGLGWTAADQLSLIAGGVEVARLTEAAGVVQMILPLANTPLTPTLAFGNGDTGFYESSDNAIRLAFSGGAAWQFTASNLGGFSTKPTFANETPSATNPNVLPDAGDADTGIGSAAADQLSLVAGGVEMLRLVEAGGLTDQVIIAPAGGSVGDASATPTLAFGDGNTGFYESADNVLQLTIAGTNSWTLSGTILGAANASRGAILNIAPTATIPNLVSNQSDADTGMGWAGNDKFTMIAGGVSALELVESAGSVFQSFQARLGLTAHVGSSQGDGNIISSFNVYSTVANAGDAATLPASFGVGRLIYVKNDAAGNSMDVFPASGDDAGAGVNTAVAVASGDFAVFIGIVADTTWTKLMGGTA